MNYENLRTFVENPHSNYCTTLLQSAQLNLQRSERSFMAQVRLGMLPLHIETGRFNDTPVHERICKLCDSNMVEDEKHFILHCPKYTLLIYPKQTNFQPCLQIIADSLQSSLKTLINLDLILLMLARN